MALYLLRVKQLGFSLNELDEIDEGDVWDMGVELGNDRAEWEDAPTWDNADAVMV